MPGVFPGRVGGAQRAVNADLLLNDIDPDGDSLTITRVDGDAAGIGIATAGSNGGTFTIRADGSYTFDPGTAFDNLKADATRTTSVTYTVADTNGATDRATLTVTVRAGNAAPEWADDAGTTHRYQVLTVADGDGDSATGTLNADLLLNDTDPDGDALGITGVKGYTAAVNRDGEHTTRQGRGPRRPDPRQPRR